jgi:hypothetical protein
VVSGGNMHLNKFAELIAG